MNVKKKNLCIIMALAIVMAITIAIIPIFTFSAQAAGE